MAAQDEVLRNQSSEYPNLRVRRSRDKKNLQVTSVEHVQNKPASVVDSENLSESIKKSEYPKVLVRKLQNENKIAKNKPMVIINAESLSHCLQMLKYPKVLLKKQKENENDKTKPASVEPSQSSELTDIIDSRSLSERIQSEYPKVLVKRLRNEAEIAKRCEDNKYQLESYAHGKVHKSSNGSQMTKNLFKCSNCNYISSSRHDLNRHVTLHSQKKLFRCNKCSYSSKCKAYFTIHRRIHSSVKGLIECKKCGYGTRRPDLFQRHLVTHSAKKKVFECNKCSFKTRCLDYFKRHFAYHVKNKNKFKCENCNYCTIFSSHLKRHAQSHSDELPSKCDSYRNNHTDSMNIYQSGIVDQLKASQKSWLKETLKPDKKTDRTTRPDRQKCHESRPSSEKKTLTCGRCNFSTNYLSNLKRHQSIHSEKRLRNCDKCSYSTNRIDLFKRHQKAHQGRMGSTFDKHSYSAKSSDHAKRQQRTPSSEQKIFKCNKCRYSTNRSHYMKCHLIGHSVNKKYLSCIKCGYIASRLYDLKKHSIKHLKTSFKCSACSFETKYRSNLRKHFLTHSINKSFKDMNSKDETVKTLACDSEKRMDQETLSSVEDIGDESGKKTWKFTPSKDFANDSKILEVKNHETIIEGNNKRLKINGSDNELTIQIVKIQERFESSAVKSDIFYRGIMESEYPKVVLQKSNAWNKYKSRAHLNVGEVQINEKENNKMDFDQRNVSYETGKRVKNIANKLIIISFTKDGKRL